MNVDTVILSKQKVKIKAINMEKIIIMIRWFYCRNIRLALHSKFIVIQCISKTNEKHIMMSIYQYSITETKTPSRKD